MYHKALTMVLFGVLFMGAATLTYGTCYGEGFAPSMAGIMGLGEEQREGKEKEHDDE
jgi:hypothetical protein